MTDTKLLSRFLAKIGNTTKTGCVEWTAATINNSSNNKYGLMKVDSRRLALAHRISYELFIGEIPSGATIDHTCSNTICVNPGHLEPVTIRENIRRGVIRRQLKGAA